ncbi:hypothetical protein GE061_000080 [Apolygus lucorum]|uniref:Reverse transcriptase domain-containing protein n=1 Tax=Apolygus lucorum TaxID=248454 RepID=A0A6A4KLC0_APOLU|nr:hypothetical protein GE061_000080 [Apolygus lucorum]
MGKADWSKFRTGLEKCLDTSSWTPALTPAAIDAEVTWITRSLMEAAQLAIPRSRPSPFRTWWWTPALRKEKRTIRRTRKMMARAEGLARQALAEIYRHRRRAYTKSIKVAKKEAWRKLVTARGRGDPWGLPYKLVSGKRKPAGIFITQEDSTWTEAASRLLNALVPDDSTVAENRDHQRIRDYVNEGPTSSNEEPLAFSQEEIKNAIWRCAKKKAPGEDGVTAEILRAAWVSAKERLTALYNSCLKESYFPKAWTKILP